MAHTGHSRCCRRFNQEGLVPKCNMMVEADGIRKGRGAKGKVAVKKAKAKRVQEEEEEAEEGEEGSGVRHMQSAGVATL